MLGTAVRERERETQMSHYWLRQIPQDAALNKTRGMLLLPGETLLAADRFPLYRTSLDSQDHLHYKTTPKHVVMIMMESFSAEFIGALGAKNHATPEFDKLSTKGVLFDRFFSQGTHTHQGLFATLCSFPNLPGYEYLMQNSQGQQAFRSLPAVLQEQGFQTLYVYNGSFTWDNQEGFFRNQGMQRFVGRDDYINPVFKDPTWGVSDEDMFVRGVDEITQLAEHGQVFALLQTVSNHAPFQLPAPAPSDHAVRRHLGAG